MTPDPFSGPKQPHAAHPTVDDVIDQTAHSLAKTTWHVRKYTANNCKMSIMTPDPFSGPEDFDGAKATEGVVGVTRIGDGIIAGGVRAGPGANLLAKIIVGIVDDALSVDDLNGATIYST
jgi:hypothetical protein